MEAASPKARLALWYGLQRSCQEAVRALKAAGPPGAGESGTGGGESGVEGHGGASKDSKKGPKQPEAKLDFFGAEVRAQVGGRRR